VRQNIDHSKKFQFEITLQGYLQDPKNKSITWWDSKPYLTDVKLSIKIDI